MACLLCVRICLTSNLHFQLGNLLFIVLMLFLGSLSSLNHFFFHFILPISKICPGMVLIFPGSLEIPSALPLLL